MITYAQLCAYEWLAVPMWVFDRKLRRITWANQAALAFWQAASAAALRERSYDDITCVTQERLDTAHGAALLGQCLEEYWTLYPAGQAREVLLQSNVAEDVNGATEGLLFCANNLKALPHTERRGVQVLLYTPLPVAFYQFDGQLLYSNPAAIRVFANRAGVAAPVLHEIFVHAEDASLIVEYINRGNVFRGECEMHTNAGIRIFDLTCHPGVDPVSGEPAIGLSAADVTEHKLVERERDDLRENQVREAKADAMSERQRTIRARKLFMATASHEQRTPLQTVIGCIDRLEQQPRDIAQCLVELKDAAEQLIRINEDLVEFIRVDSAPGPRLKIVNAQDLVERALLPSRKAAAAKGLALTLEASDLDRNIQIDAMRVRQVISNLAGNAVKYTRTGSVAVHAAIDGGPGAFALSLSIRDTGAGMDAAFTARVLLPFIRGPESALVDPQGLGLGLAIVQSHLAELNGTFHIASVMGEGTAVSVTIPCHAPF